MNESGAVEGPTDLSLMTVNTGFGEIRESQGMEITPLLMRALNDAPDAPGPLVWVYPYHDYQDLAAKGDAALAQAFFQDWFVARGLAGGLPLNTVIHTGAFLEWMKKWPEKLRESVLVAPTPVILVVQYI